MFLPISIFFYFVYYHICVCHVSINITYLLTYLLTYLFTYNRIRVTRFQQPATRFLNRVISQLTNSETDFEVFRPAWATRCTDGGEIWHGGGERSAKFHSHRCNDKGIGPQNWNFTEIWSKCGTYAETPTGAYPLRDFHKICRVCTSFHVASDVKISLDFSLGYGVIVVLSCRGLVAPKYSEPHSSETMDQTPKILEV